MCPKTLTNTRKQLNKKLKNQQFCLDARNHYPQIKHHTPPPSRATTPPQTSTGLKTQVLSQDPTVCSAALPSTPNPGKQGNSLLRTKPDRPLQAPALISQPHRSRTMRGWGNEMVLLRKEVIQPHLPVRLPCYDFVPIADPTFDSSPHKG
jgi:hypothetical protein